MTKAILKPLLIIVGLLISCILTGCVVDDSLARRVPLRGNILIYPEFTNDKSGVIINMRTEEMYNCANYEIEFTHTYKPFLDLHTIFLKSAILKKGVCATAFGPAETSWRLDHYVSSNRVNLIYNRNTYEFIIEIDSTISIIGDTTGQIKPVDDTVFYWH